MAVADHRQGRLSEPSGGGEPPSPYHTNKAKDPRSEGPPGPRRWSGNKSANGETTPTPRSYPSHSPTHSPARKSASGVSEIRRSLVSSAGTASLRLALPSSNSSTSGRQGRISEPSGWGKPPPSQDTNPSNNFSPEHPTPWHHPKNGCAAPHRTARRAIPATPL